MAKTKKLKTAIIGTGGISGVHHAGYEGSPNAELYAICDIQPDILKDKGDRWGIPEERRFLKYKDLLKLDEIDAVSVCTPNKHHCTMTCDALKAGKHVLCEKPMAMDPRQAQRMVDTAAETGKQLQIGLMNRFRQDARYVRGLVDDGTLGEIQYARCQAIRRRGVPSWGVFGQMEEQGGGGLIDIGVHMIDLCWWMMGEPRPVSVTGQTFRSIGATPGHFGQFGQWDWRTYTVEDLAAAFVRFETGAVMTIECSFIANLDQNRMGSHISGAKGGAGISPLNVQLELNGHLCDCTPQHFTTVDLHGVPVKLSNHELEVQSFCHAVANGRDNEVPASQAIWTQKIINAIYKSAESGREVKIK